MDYISVFSEVMKTTPITNKDMWVGSRFEYIKRTSTTNKGDIGEVYATHILSDVGINAKIVRPKTSYDVITESSDKIEVKLATLDTNYNFQFNGIRMNREYDYVIFIGIMPNDIVFNFLSKHDVLNYNLCPMEKGQDKSNGGLKLTMKRTNMLSYEDCITRIKEILI